MESRINKHAQLPSFPSVAIQLLKIFSEPEIGISDVVAVLQTDPALSGKILKATNTSQMGLRKPVSDLQRAVVLLGKKSVMALALGFSLSEASMNTGKYSIYYSDFWFQSLIRGCAASVLAQRYFSIEGSEAFTLGLLARIGRLAMLHTAPEQFVATILKAEQTGQSCDAIELQSGEVTSTDLTVHFFKEWNLPNHCINAIEALPTSLDEVCSSPTPSGTNFSDLIRISAAFGEFFSGERRGVAMASLYELCSVILGEPESQVNELVDRVRAELDKYSALFNLDTSKIDSPLELLSQAMSQLSQLAASYSSTLEEPNKSSRELKEENSRLRKRIMELTQTAMIDPLTKAFNRSYMIQQLTTRSQFARQDQTPVALLFTDIDHFKQINDQHGHLAGDEILKSVATSIREVIRHDDILTRFGGEEFVILSSATDAEGLQRQAERIRDRIEQESRPIGNIELKVTVSIGGVVVVPPRHCHDFVQQLIDTADRAMYMSKHSGRNCITILQELSQNPILPLQSAS